MLKLVKAILGDHHVEPKEIIHRDDYFPCFNGSYLIFLRDHQGGRDLRVSLPAQSGTIDL
jgi:hypothetical protein